MSNCNKVACQQKNQPKPSTSQAARVGQRAPEPKVDAAATGAKKTSKIELDAEKIPLGKLIMQGRQARGLSQKDLAMKIFEKHQVIADYEAGRGPTNDAILGKIERVIEVKLRGKDRGQAFTPYGKK